ncbi:nuclear transport factor 2 family protein [Streptomyces sp. NBC_01320]|uniref:nuclear transport factor 2 family protein n=1 Tax=Streptomyces sp. NBC_01320 TaxID=2903824 RepID=UPI002E0E3D23|nr:nuclear transport factor 2 family protein [Streptomyces sp. NBC_01320]
MTARAQDVLQEFMTRLGDPATIRQAFDLVAEEFVAHEPDSLPYRGEHHGPRGMRALLRQINELFELTVQDVRVSGAGDGRALADVELRVRSRSSSSEIVTRVLELYQIKDGKIVGLDVFYRDTHALLGLLEG